MQQLLLNIQLRNQANFNNFYISAANQGTLQYLQNFFHQSAERSLYLWSAPQQGRSHLLQACCDLAAQKNLLAIYLSLKNPSSLSIEVLQNLEHYDVVCLDDIDTISGHSVWEEALFHLYNRLQTQQRYLLLTADCAPRQLKLTLPDLKSRLAAAAVFHLYTLSDAEKLALLQLHATQRGLNLPIVVGRFLLNHWPRDTKALLMALDQLDHAALTAKHGLTVPFVKAVLKL